MANKNKSRNSEGYILDETKELYISRDEIKRIAQETIEMLAPNDEEKQTELLKRFISRNFS